MRPGIGNGVYRGMVVGIGIVNIHVFEEPLYVFVEEALDLSIIEFRVNKEGANVRLHNV